MAGKFEPDEPITSIEVRLHTAALSDASTDSDITVELFDIVPDPSSPIGLRLGEVEIDTDGYNDFEWGDTKLYTLPKWFYSGRIVNDIRRVCLHKGDDWGSDWGFGWISVRVNGKELYTSPGYYTAKEDVVWLSDGESWCANDFKPYEFTDPVIVDLGLPDTDADTDYAYVLHATGGRKTLAWRIVSSSGNAFASGPKLVPVDAKGTQAKLSGHTVAAAPGPVTWTGTIEVKDADGRSSTRKLTLRVVDVLPPPTVQEITPAFGWPALPPSAPQPVIVTVKSGGKNFDSRKPGATRVFFKKAGGGRQESTPIEVTAEALRVKVPGGAVSGQITVATGFGEADSPFFLVYPNGYRFLNGYSFKNSVNDDNDDGWPNTFAWERYEQTFGIDEMWLDAFDQAIVPNPIATNFYLLSHDLIGEGVCHGFCLTSLQMSHGLLPSSFPTSGNPYPLDGTLWNLSGPGKPSGGLSAWIQTRQLVVWSDEALTYYLDWIDNGPMVHGNLCEMEATPALNEVKNAVAQGFTDPVMIAIAEACSPTNGHVVVGYATAKEGDVERILVYDPNKPARVDTTDDQGSAIWVKPGDDGHWGYTMSTGKHWNGLYIIPIRLSEYGHNYDWTLPGLSTLFGTVGVILGAAGTDAGCRIVQVTDGGQRRLFDDDGDFIANRRIWPEGARLVPFWGGSGKKRPMIMLTGEGEQVFTVAPLRHQLGTFAVVRGSDESWSVEEIRDRIDVGYDAGTRQAWLRPTADTSTTVIVRHGHRNRIERSTVEMAIRAHGVTKDSRLIFAPATDRTGVLLNSDTSIKIDLEVTFVDALGRRRVFECDGIALTGRTSFAVTDADRLDDPRAKPVILEAEDGTTRELAANVTGLQVEAPLRIVTRPRVSVLGAAAAPEAPVRIAATAHGPARQGVHLAVLGRAGAIPPPSGGMDQPEDGVVVVPLAAGTHPVRLVATDRSGRRSFSRTVFVTVPDQHHKAVPVRTLGLSDLVMLPGSKGEIAVVIDTGDDELRHLDVGFSIRDRLSGLGTGRAQLAPAFTLAPELSAAGAEATVQTDASGITLHLNIEFPAGAVRGRAAIGRLGVDTAADTHYGSAFILRGNGTCTIARGREFPINVIPSAVRVWGGPKPAALEISGETEVGEGMAITLNAVATGLSHGATTAGWWIERKGGLANVRVDPTDTFTATVNGQRAGLVHVHVVVGERVATTVVRVTPTVRPSRLRLSEELAKSLLRRPIQIPGPPPVEYRPPGWRADIR